jgi:hypothetical protein
MSQKITVHPSQNGTGKFTVPARFVRALPADARFEPEFTDEGILFRFVGIAPTSPHPKVEPAPNWAANGEPQEATE